MAVKVYAPSTPIPARRTLFFTIVLFGLVSALAGSMAVQRGSDPLGPRIAPRGWAMSFRIPKGWIPGTPVPGGSVTVFPFHGQSADRTPVDLAVWQIDEQLSGGPTEICSLILRQYGAPGSETTLGGVPVTGRKAFGSIPGVEAMGPNGSTVVRAVVLDRRVGYAMSLNAGPSTIDKALYELFDLTCRSVEYPRS